MHEVSLICSLLEMIKESAVENSITNVSKVKLVVGEAHGALPDALDFAFRVLTKDSVCAGAELEIETSPLLCRCRDCGGKFHPATFSYRCPSCHVSNVEPVSGRELRVDYYEGE